MKDYTKDASVPLPLAGLLNDAQKAAAAPIAAHSYGYVNGEYRYALPCGCDVGLRPGVKLFECEHRLTYRFDTL